MYKKFLLFIFIIIFIPFFNLNVSADSYNYDIWGDAVPSQSGYTAEKSISGKNLGITDFSSPQDLYKDADNNFFIADSGNNRIIKINNDWTDVISVIDEIKYNNQISTLKNPCGIYKSPYDKFIYIADTDNSRVIKCDENGNADIIIEKPVSELYTDTENSGFFPEKVITDKAGYIYIVVGNQTNGALMFDKNGVFIGYYGANHIETTSEVVSNYISNIFSSYEIRLRNSRSVPSAFTNFDTDKNGFMFTCTETGAGSDTIKKINPAGDNLFQNYTVKFGDYTDYYSVSAPMMSDIDISESGYINCLDSSSGRIFQYDKNCRLVFITGGKSEQLGGFKNVSAIESADNYLYIADAGKNNVTVFKISEFGENVHNAVSLCEKGEYEKALPLWLETLRHDGNYSIAYEEISNAMFSMGDYKSAMDYAEMAVSSKLYNDAFEEYRSENSGKYFIYLLIGIVLLITFALILLKKLKKKPVSSSEWAFNTIIHPIEGFEDVLWKKKCSVKIMVLILIALLISEIFCDRLFGFQFHAQYSKTFSIIPYFFRSIICFFMWTIGNWSVCCLLDGKGTFKNICAVSSYALIPYIIQNFIITLLSHFLTRDEQFFLTAITAVGILWSVIMMFSAVKSVHQYSVLKTIMAIIMTVAAMAVIFFILILMLSLFRQIYIFIYTIYTEIIYRII